ncbi:MAG: bifunctional oligoribonuclease/PAP phosphatase NrnA [Bacteroidetes bacterium]|nr:bifunctional oligoribonuclease/PAP phosphatase NrnA [Bacteroidota bacterium]
MSNRFPAKELEELKKILSVPQMITITTHHRPDGDAMGSSLALYNYLIRKGHGVIVVTPSECPEFLSWLPGNDVVIDFEKREDAAMRTIAVSTLVFCLDFNWLSRLEKLEQPVRNSNAIKVLIDHHLEPEPAFDHAFSYTDACSTCELIYQFIDALGDKKMIDKNIAECIYTGIMTDTNSFRYATMRSETHRIIADLMDAGAENYKIHEYVYDTWLENRLRLLGYSLKEKLKVLTEYNTAYIALSQAELDMFNFKAGDTEGIVNYALSIKGVRLAALFTEREGEIKISFRSKDDFSVKDLSSKYFQGGGHKNASGGKSNESLDATVQKFLGILPHYQSQLAG